MTDQAPKLHAAKRYVLACLGLSALPLFYLLFDLLTSGNEGSSWLAMRLAGAQLLLEEEKLYVDFWDWSQPVVYDLLRMLLVLRDGLEKIGIFYFALPFAQIAVWLLVLLSLVLTALIAYQALRQVDAAEGPEQANRADQIKEASLAILFSTALASLIMRFDFGDLPHLLVLALAPWIFLRWLAYRDLDFKASLALPVGLLAGLAACFDLPFAFVFFIVEIVMVSEAALNQAKANCNLKKNWKGIWKWILGRLLRPEMLGFLLSILFCLLRLTLLEPPVSSAFWQWIMPLRLLNYQVYDAALYAAESCPDRRDILYGLTLACAVAVSLQAKNSFFLPPFLLALSGFVLYLIERQGLSRDLSLTIFGVTTIGALSFLILGRRMLDFFLPVAEAHFLRRFRQVFFVVVAVAMVGLTAYSLNCDRDRLYVFMVGRGQAYEDLLSVYNKNAVWEKPVMVLSDYPAAAYPALLNFKAKCHGYLLWSRPLRLFEWVKEHRVLAPPLKDFYNYMIAKLRTDIGSGDANLIVVQHAARDTLVRSGLAAELDEKYTEGAPCRYVSRNEQPREYAGTNDFDRFMRRF